MANNKKKAQEAEPKTEAAPALETVEPSKQEAPSSRVDQVFDKITAWAADGLSITKRGLEASARWLDARAKVVGDLAAKLGSKPA
ncbi:MAG: hypothetical protein KF819_04825 [Labilithrix sp.]|nr:hypothetical protein [Labilithrix sp.]